MDKIIKNYEQLKTEGENIIHFLGLIDKEKIENMLQNIEDNASNFSKKIRRKLFFISVEMLQNLYHHGMQDLKDETKPCLFNISYIQEEQTLKLSSGNFVTKEQYDILQNKLDKLNELSEEETKILYKQILSNNQFSEKGGGGLGIVDIKRRSEMPIKYNSINLNKNLYFFNFFVFLKNKI